VNCSQYDENVYVYATGALEGPERDELLAHLSTGCPECSAKLAEAEAVLGLVGVSVLEGGEGKGEVLAGAKAALDEQIGRYLVAGATGNGTGLSNGHYAAGNSEGVVSAEREGLGVAGGAGTMSIARGGRRFRWAMPAALAAVLAASVTAGVMYMILDERDRRISGLESEVAAKWGMVQQREQELADAQADNEKLAELKDDLKSAQDELKTVKDRVSELEKQRESTQTQLVALQKDHEEDQKTIEMLHSKQLLAVDLKGQPGVNGEAQARLLVDLQGKVWKLYGANFKPIEGRVYEFWLVTADGKKVPMGTFSPDGRGRGELGDKVPDPMPAVVAAAITDEPVGGSPQPTGAMQAVGKIQVQ
jgi:hypothetical protein